MRYLTQKLLGSYVVARMAMRKKKHDLMFFKPIMDNAGGYYQKLPSRWFLPMLVSRIKAHIALQYSSWVSLGFCQSTW